MSNRRNMKNNSLRIKKSPSVLQRGLARIMQPDNRPHVPTHDEAFSHGDSEADRYREGRHPLASPVLTEEEVAKMVNLTMPASNELVIKVVPARHKGVTVGDAFIHDDGQISLVLDSKAPQWALDEIKAEAHMVGYSLETGAPIDGAP